MILRRLGNKKKIAKEIQKHFPPHKTYIEPFFGAGGMFFNKPKAEHNMLNDLDSDVFNLFITLKNEKDELLSKFIKTPINEDLIKYWIDEKENSNNVMKSIRFLFISNFVLNGNGYNLRTNAIENSKKQIENKIDNTFDYIKYCRFFNKDYKKFIESIAFRQDKEKSSTFIYCDPPYLGTNDNYSNSFTEDQSNELFETLINTGCKFAVSEFDHPFILQQAKDRGLNVIIIGERQNLKNTRTEILVTNYENTQQKLF